MSAINPYLKQLGFQADDRVVVVHADDIGMCHATLPAIDELMAFGLVTSASVMVPCPWFLEAASWHRRNPQFDLGIHLTLTSEWHTTGGGLSPAATREAACWTTRVIFTPRPRTCPAREERGCSDRNASPDRSGCRIGHQSLTC